MLFHGGGVSDERVARGERRCRDGGGGVRRPRDDDEFDEFDEDEFDEDAKNVIIAAGGCVVERPPPPSFSFDFDESGAESALGSRDGNELAFGKMGSKDAIARGVGDGATFSGYFTANRAESTEHNRRELALTRGDFVRRVRVRVSREHVAVVVFQRHRRTGGKEHSSHRRCKYGVFAVPIVLHRELRGREFVGVRFVRFSGFVWGGFRVL